MSTFVICFTIPGVPGRKGRPRFSRRGQHVVVRNDDATMEFESRVAMAAQSCFPTPFDGPIRLMVTAVYPRTIGLSGIDKKRNVPKYSAGRLFKDSAPDIDNVVKAVADGLNGIAWVDDRQVVQMLGEKYWAAMSLDEGGGWHQESAGTEVMVKALSC